MQPVKIYTKDDIQYLLSYKEFGCSFSHKFIKDCVEEDNVDKIFLAIERFIQQIIHEDYVLQIRKELE